MGDLVKHQFLSTTVSNSLAFFPASYMRLVCMSAALFLPANETSLMTLEECESQSGLGRCSLNLNFVKKGVRKELLFWGSKHMSIGIGSVEELLFWETVVRSIFIF